MVAHDVVSIKYASSFRKKIPKSYRSHANKKLILFCNEHDDFICHECLSDKHRKCNKIVEIETAAEGVRESAAITDLKERMMKFTSDLEKTQIENEQQLSKISIEKREYIKPFKGVYQQNQFSICCNVQFIQKCWRGIKVINSKLRIYDHAYQNYLTYCRTLFQAIS